MSAHRYEPTVYVGSLLGPSVENKLEGSLPTRASCRAAQNCHFTCEAGFVPTLALTALQALFSCYPFFLSAPDNRPSQLCVFCKGIVAVIQYLAFSGGHATLRDVHVGSFCFLSLHSSFMFSPQCPVSCTDQSIISPAERQHGRWLASLRTVREAAVHIPVQALLV